MNNVFINNSMRLTKTFFRGATIALVTVVAIEAVVTLLSGNTLDVIHLVRWVLEVGAILTVWELLKPEPRPPD